MLIATVVAVSHHLSPYYEIKTELSSLFLHKSRSIECTLTSQNYFDASSCVSGFFASLIQDMRAVLEPPPDLASSLFFSSFQLVGVIQAAWFPSPCTGS